MICRATTRTKLRVFELATGKWKCEATTHALYKMKCLKETIKTIGGTMMTESRLSYPKEQVQDHDVRTERNAVSR